ncbi:ABC transporter permease [Paenibacillus sp. CN-4]|uniref:ABC transporter permease n=1 Tax=Paenibacillus nanchangensis TaxID=3348343 RepID=UPI0039787829
MANFMSLVHNENIKIYRRIRTWVMLVILAGMGIMLPALVYLTGGNSSEIALWDSFQMTVMVCFFMNTIFTVVIASDAVAGEFSWGTIKLLLIRPWSRSKILLSKYVSLILFSLFATALLLLCAYGSSMIFSTQGVTSSVPEGWTEASYSLAMALCSYIQLFLTAALAFMVSAVFRASALAIGLSMFILFAKNIMLLIFNPSTYPWANYLPFPHMDLSGYLSSATGPAGVSLWFSVGVLGAYYVLFLAVAWTVFSKRDVAA